MNKKGLTLIEVMIIVLVFAILLAIVLPNFLSAREAHRQKECLATLASLDRAGVQYVWEHNSKTNMVPKPEMDVVVRDYRNGYEPKCLSGGKYSYVHPIVDGVELKCYFPACSKHGIYNPLKQDFMKQGKLSKK